ncbi:Hypothetical protein PBC10988_28680 [Planctomycetales bacterium 10988]|nr:Hypothetical protein PBC10988_28680 [Planctomycetales bacterium 10988]
MLGLSLAMVLSTETLSAQTVKELITQLREGDGEEKLEAIDELADYGAQAKPAIRPLIRVLNGGDEEAQWRAARTLGSIGPDAEPAIDALAKALKSDSTLVKAQSAFALGRIGKASAKVAPELAEAFTDENALVRRAVLRALTNIRPGPKVMIPLMAQAMQKADPAHIVPILQTLSEFGEEVVPPLTEALKEEGEARYWALIVLADIGPDARAAVPALVEVLKSSEDEQIRLRTLLALAAIGPAAEEAVPAIITSMEKDTVGNSFCAIYALSEIGTSETVSALKKATEHDDLLTKLLASWALAKLLPEDAEYSKLAAEQMVLALQSEKKEEQRVAARLLIELDAPSDKTRKALSDALDRFDPEVLEAVIEVVSELGETAVPRLVQALENPMMQQRAIRVLMKLGPKAASAVPAITAAIKNSEDPEYIEGLQFTLGAIGESASAAVPTLVESLSSEDVKIRRSAIAALGSIGPGAKAALPALQDVMNGEDEFLKYQSAWSILRIADKNPKAKRGAMQTVLKGLRSDNEYIRSESANVLGSLKGMASERVIAALKKALKDKSPVVSGSAEQALEALGEATESEEDSETLEEIEIIK